MLIRNARTIALYALAAAVCAVLFSPLLALSYFATGEGAKELKVGTISAWAEPGRELAGSLLTFASPDRVYSVYTLVFALLFPAVILAAGVVRSQRSTSQTKPEVWGWRLARIGYTMFGVGLGIVAVALIFTTPEAAVVNIAFMGLMFPGLLLSLIGSTILGSALVRTDHQPRTAAWLLALAIPLWIVGNVIVGHNSIGLVPLFIAWAANSASLRRADEARSVDPGMSQVRGYEGSSA